MYFVSVAVFLGLVVVKGPVLTQAAAEDSSREPPSSAIVNGRERKLFGFNTNLQINLCAGENAASADTFYVDFPAFSWIAPMAVSLTSSYSQTINIFGPRPEAIRITASGSDEACLESVVLSNVAAVGKFPQWLGQPCGARESYGAVPCETHNTFSLIPAVAPQLNITLCDNSEAPSSGAFVLDFPENSGSPRESLYPASSMTHTVLVTGPSTVSMQMTAATSDAACFSHITLDGLVVLSSEMWFQDVCDNSTINGSPCVSSYIFGLPPHYYANLSLSLCAANETEALSEGVFSVTFPSNSDSPAISVTPNSLAILQEVVVVGWTPPTSIQISSTSMDEACFQSVALDGLEATGQLPLWMGSTACSNLSGADPCATSQTWSLPAAVSSILYVALCQHDEADGNGAISVSFPSNAGSPAALIYPRSPGKHRVTILGSYPSSLTLTAISGDPSCIEAVALDDVDATITNTQLPKWLSHNCPITDCVASMEFSLTSYYVAYTTFTLCQDIVHPHSVDVFTVEFPSNPDTSIHILTPGTTRAVPFSIIGPIPTSIVLTPYGEDAVCVEAITVDDAPAYGLFPTWVDKLCQGDDFQGLPCWAKQTWSLTSTTSTTTLTTSTATTSTATTSTLTTSTSSTSTVSTTTLTNTSTTSTTSSSTSVTNTSTTTSSSTSTNTSTSTTSTTFTTSTSSTMTNTTTTVTSTTRTSTTVTTSSSTTSTSTVTTVSSTTTSTLTNTTTWTTTTTSSTSTNTTTGTTTTDSTSTGTTSSTSTNTTTTSTTQQQSGGGGGTGGGGHGGGTGGTSAPVVTSITATETTSATATSTTTTTSQSSTWTSSTLSTSTLPSTSTSTTSQSSTSTSSQTSSSISTTTSSQTTGTTSVVESTVASTAEVTTSSTTSATTTDTGTTTASTTTGTITTATVTTTTLQQVDVTTGAPTTTTTTTLVAAVVDSFVPSTGGGGDIAKSQEQMQQDQAKAFVAFAAQQAAAALAAARTSNESVLSIVTDVATVTVFKMANATVSGGYAAVSQAGSVTSVDVPTEAISALGADAAVVVTQFSDSIFAASSAQTGLGTALSVDVSSLSSGSSTTVEGLTNPISITLPIRYDETQTTCSFFDEATQQWSSRGVSVAPGLQNGDWLRCFTSHLSLFGALLAGFTDAFACSNIGLLTAKAVANLAVGDWYTSSAATFYWCLVPVLFAIFMGACLTDKRRGRTLAWSDEFFLIAEHAGPEDLKRAQEASNTEAAEGEAEPKPKEGLLLGMGFGCCTTLGICCTLCRSSAVFEALDEVLSNWCANFAEIRAICEGILEAMDLSSLAGGTGFMVAASHRVMSSMVLSSSRRLAAAEMKLSEDVISFVLDDEDMKDLLVQVHDDHVERDSEQPRPPQQWRASKGSREAWVQMHHAVSQQLQKHVGRHGWRELPLIAYALFLAGNPIGSVFLFSPFMSCQMRAFFVNLEVMGSLLVLTIFYSSTGGAKKQRVDGPDAELDDDKCNGPPADGMEQVFYTIGRAIAIALVSLLVAGIPIRFLQTLHTRGFRKMAYRGCPEWDNQLRVWRTQDRMIWVLGSLYLVFCHFFVLLFLANLSDDYIAEWSICSIWSVLWDCILIPIGFAMIMPFIASCTIACLACAARVHRTELIGGVREHMLRNSNAMLPIMHV